MTQLKQRREHGRSILRLHEAGHLVQNLLFYFLQLGRRGDVRDSDWRILGLVSNYLQSLQKGLLVEHGHRTEKETSDLISSFSRLVNIGLLVFTGRIFG